MFLVGLGLRDGRAAEAAGAGLGAVGDSLADSKNKLAERGEKLRVCAPQTPTRGYLDVAKATRCLSMTALTVPVDAECCRLGGIERCKGAPVGLPNTQRRVCLLPLRTPQEMNELRDTGRPFTRLTECVPKLQVSPLGVGRRLGSPGAPSAHFRVCGVKDAELT
jgi:hypothetical protein